MLCQELLEDAWDYGWIQAATNAAAAVGKCKEKYTTWFQCRKYTYYTGPSIVLFFIFHRFSVGIRSRDYANEYRALTGSRFFFSPQNNFGHGLIHVSFTTPIPLTICPVAASLRQFWIITDPPSKFIMGARRCILLTIPGLCLTVR